MLGCQPSCDHEISAGGETLSPPLPFSTSHFPAPNVFPTEPLLRENFIFIFSSWKNGKVRRECSEKRPSERYIIPGKMVGQ